MFPAVTDQRLFQLGTRLGRVLQNDKGFYPFNLGFVRDSDHTGVPDFGMLV